MLYFNKLLKYGVTNNDLFFEKIVTTDLFNNEHRLYRQQYLICKVGNL